MEAERKINEDRSLISLPSQQLVAQLPTPNRILGEMVESSLALANGITPTNIDPDILVRQGKRIQAGDGMSEQNIRAFNLFHIAAIAGHPEAQNCLSACYLNGIGVPKDKSNGYKWLFAAATAGFEFAAIKAAAMVQFWLTTPADFVPSESFLEIANACRPSAEEGNRISQYVIGCFYRDGKGFPQDTDKALLWLKRSADGGHLSAHLALGDYFYGIYDFDQAFDHYWVCAVKGEGKAQKFIGMCYHVGASDRVKIDLPHACAWYQLAEDDGFKKNDGFNKAVGAAKSLASLLTPEELESARSLYRKFKKEYSRKK
jgi:TPR repeat protein